MHSFFLMLVLAFLGFAIWTSYRTFGLRGEEAVAWLALTKLNWDALKVTLVVWFFVWLITLIV
ncbi:hypothetical protein [Endozoicomonas numazuensis]|uniref:hypothetical protein n=1 Tax=Endozoicomonas numazuensis TaxID=1137799 RepID=UPI000B29B3FC|nr:hypothetical protein [Endozoicomonas numazuensis]